MLADGGQFALLRLIAGFDQPDEGSIRIAGEEVAYLPPFRKVNTVFQSYALPALQRLGQVFDDNNAMYAKPAAGAAGYDIVVSS